MSAKIMMDNFFDKTQQNQLFIMKLNKNENQVEVEFMKMKIG